LVKLSGNGTLKITGGFIKLPDTYNRWITAFLPGSDVNVEMSGGTIQGCRSKDCAISVDTEVGSKLGKLTISGGKIDVPNSFYAVASEVTTAIDAPSAINGIVLTLNTDGTYKFTVYGHVTTTGKFEEFYEDEDVRNSSYVVSSGATWNIEEVQSDMTAFMASVDMTVESGGTLNVKNTQFKCKGTFTVEQGGEFIIDDTSTWEFAEGTADNDNDHNGGSDSGGGGGNGSGNNGGSDSGGSGSGSDNDNDSGSDSDNDGGGGNDIAEGLGGIALTLMTPDEVDTVKEEAKIHLAANDLEVKGAEPASLSANNKIDNDNIDKALVSSAIAVSQHITRGGVVVLGKNLGLPLKDKSLAGEDISAATSFNDLKDKYSVMKYFPNGSRDDLLERYGDALFAYDSAEKMVKFKKTIIVADKQTPSGGADFISGPYGVKLTDKYLYVFDGNENGTAQDPITLQAKSSGSRSNNSSSNGGCSAGYGLFGLLLAGLVTRKYRKA
jgi:uncharacterized membrane protein YgcG